MASGCTSCSATSLGSLFGSGRVFILETTQSEASPSNREDGPVRVRCSVERKFVSGPVPGLQRQLREIDCPSLTCSAFPSSGSSSSPSPTEWWRNPPQAQSGRVTGSRTDVPELRVAQVASEVETMFPSHQMLDWPVDSTEWKEYSFEETPTSRGSSGGVPVFVMLPLDTVSINNTLNRRRALNASLLALKSAGVEGVMMDVWWGIVEKDGPRQYNWSAYKDLIDLVKKHGLKVQAVMSFHQCGGNVGDSCSVPLPKWVTEQIDSNPDIVYTDKAGKRNYEYLSLGCDTLPVLEGRSPVQTYADFMRSFRDTFEELVGETIVEIQVGMGPAGELRYPSYPESEGRWRFPGIGEFQCFDKYMMASLKCNAEAVGNSQWGVGGPHNAGYYNQFPNESGFFHKEGSWNSDYGQFFMEWYSEMLIAHGDRILAAASGIFRGTGAVISAKVAGIHWHYGTRSHPAEMTAGYYNTRQRDGYLPIARMFARHGVTFNFTCIEMRDSEQPEHALCSPEGLLRQVAVATRKAGIRLAGENALPRFDEGAHEQIVRKSRLQMDERGEAHGEFEPMCAFTFLRMCESLFHTESWRLFVPFVRHMEEGRTFQPWEEEHHSTQTHVHATKPLVQEAAALMYH